jgi:hypothetical protein
MLKLKYIIAILIGLTFLSPCAMAGKLEDFEKDATKKRVEDKTQEPGHSHHHGAESIVSRNVGSCLGEGLTTFLGLFLVEFGKTSFHRAGPDDYVVKSPSSEKETVIENRKSGQALIPITRLDISYQDVEADVSAMDYRAEVGYGPVALQVRNTHYEEERPDDDLDILQIHMLYRMSIGEKIEIDLGFGGMSLEGENGNSGLSFTVPVLVHPWDYFGVEFRPSWSSINHNTIPDYELSLLTGWRYFSLRAGYRRVMSDTESLSGPFAGISLRF